MLRDLLVVIACGALVVAPIAFSDETTSTLQLQQSNDLNPSHYTKPGQVIEFTLTTTNSGESTLHNVNLVTSLNLGVLSCSPSMPAQLVPQEVMTCIGQYTISEDDLRNASVQNIAYASSDEMTAESIGQTLYAGLGHLTLAVSVINNNSGRSTAEMWLVSASGFSSVEGWGFAQADVVVGSYSLRRDQGPRGYTLKSLVCRDSADVEVPVDGSVVVINDGEEIDCTFVYDDKVPKAAPASTTLQPPDYGYIPSILTDIPPLVDSPTTAGAGADVVVDPGCSCNAADRQSTHYMNWLPAVLLLAALWRWRQHRARRISSSQ